MCYSNCPNENYHGECIGKPDSNSHCFDGFACEECGEIYEDECDMSEIDNICIDCYNQENRE